MPTYDYECGKCGKAFEIFHGINQMKRKCPRCGAPALTRLIGAGSGVLFRGSGFYSTDYRSSEYLSKSKAESESSKPPAPASGGEKGSKAPVKPVKESSPKVD